LGFGNKGSLHMKILFAAFGVVILSSAASAQDALCFERRYDDAHMQKHKLQEVTKIKLQVAAVGAATTGTISAGFRELPGYLSSDVSCDMNGNTHVCDVTGDGGAFDFILNDKGIRLTNRKSIRFGGAEDGVTIGTEAEHKLFLLFKTACSN
jgi:hypothetical protein